MGTVLTIIAVVAIIGALIGFFGGGGNAEDAAGGAVAGVAFASGCMVQSIIYGSMALLGFWLISKIFF